jgi:streptogramin lyase
VSKAGVLSIIAGTGVKGPPTPGRATRSRLHFPYGVAVAHSGNVFIADQLNNRIEKVTRSGVLSIVAGNGQGDKPTPGPATHSALAFPSGVAVDASGNLYIADTFNNRVEKVSSKGVLSVYAGTGKVGRPTPGRAIRSRLNHPYGVSVNAAGDVYIADTFNQRIEEVTPAGRLSTIAGTGRSGRPDPGRATRSRLSQPTGTASSRSGNLYAVNFNDNDVVKITS